MQTGGFEIGISGRSHQLRAGSVFITAPGLEFHCSHSQACPDDVCIAVGFDPSAVASTEHAWARAGWAARAKPTPRLAFVQSQLSRAVDGRDAFEMERWSLAGLSALDADSSDVRARGWYAVRQSEIEVIVATCAAIDADPGAQCSIADRARAVGVTSTKLTHAFRRFLGVSPHQYVVRRRLALAAALLDQGATVSDSCWRSGFENLSHFCRTFQRTFHMRASAWRSISLRERRRKVQDVLRGAI